MNSMDWYKIKVSAKYDSGSELEVKNWILSLTGEDIGNGAMEVEKRLRNGQILVKLINAVYQGTPNRPPACNGIKLKGNTSALPFKQMENIEIFLKGAEAYGVPSNSLFPTADLFDGRNMAMVISTILQLGTEAQRHGFQGDTCGPKPSEKHIVEFTEEQLRAGQGIIGLQAGTNKLASQAGMKMGASRHIADIRADDMSKEGQCVIGLQAGSNKGASQSGMSMGAVRHIADIRADDASKEGQSVIGLQAGSNKGASQAGMSMGSVRHIADIRADKMDAGGAGIIGLQAGSNKGASQSGMSMGAVRHIADIKADDMSAASQATINLQSGTNRGANQAGMSYGGRRDIM
ncbi:myophilin [Aplysia californica]|uniref:Transgelin n=1 Tax=Aplysia californica TaxID=6500 RepID=A0ABM1A8Q6_APLCA|nr:myophilin [Aplysia californica]